MADVAIRTERLSKRYQIGQLHGGYDTLREHIVRAAKSLFRLAGPAPERKCFWALKDVSFEVAQGEVLGVIGRNGAGKSTLLKILSRITEPTEGYADIRGRLGSLLEVGTGFHPELTGRENIFLNGTILGMRRSEIGRKLGEIVEFGGVEKFIDTPVKRYSSGMYVRLAFSVAAHLEPEILLVDEVLAVGDAEFQKRCIGKLDDIGKSGRTVLFVSHAMPTVTRLCDRVILLDEGKVVEDGPAERVVARYLHSAHGTTAYRDWPEAEAPGNDLVRLRSVRIVNGELETVETVDVREPVGVEISFDVLDTRPFLPTITVRNEQGVHVFNALDPNPMWLSGVEPGPYVSTAWIPANLLNEGMLVVSVLLNTLTSGKAIRNAVAMDAAAFQTFDPGEGDSAKGTFTGTWGGAVAPLLEWTVERRVEAQSRL